jgi:hypothetical protein
LVNSKELLFMAMTEPRVTRAAAAAVAVAVGGVVAVLSGAPPRMFARNLARAAGAHRG